MHQLWPRNVVIFDYYEKIPVFLDGLLSGRPRDSIARSYNGRYLNVKIILWNSFLFILLCRNNEKYGYNTFSKAILVNSMRKVSNKRKFQLKI